MKHNKRLFNQLLYAYHKSLRKLANLRNENRNLRRQGIIEKRIKKLYARLSLLKASIQKVSFAGAMAAAAFAFMGNEAKAQFPVFDTKQINPFNLNTGYYSNPKPEFVDIDDDGDFDVFANLYVYYTGNVFMYFENTGTSTAPSYAAPTQNPFGIITYDANPPLYLYGPSFSFDFVDLDGDGDFDLFAKARYNSSFHYYENTGTNLAPSFAQPVEVNIAGTSSYENYPNFADIDGDGDYDMMIGDSGYYGDQLRFYENTGTNLSPNLISPVDDPFGLVVYTGRPSPEFVDLDVDGDFDLMIGASSYNDGFIFYENTGTNLAPSFGAPQTLPFGLTTGYYDERTNPTMADLDGDGNFDLLSGNNYGEFIYYRNKGICYPTTSTISPSSACSYISPLGNIYTSSANFTETITNVGGCDSTITINLTIDPIMDQTFSASPATVCSGNAADINLASSQNGAYYYLRNDLNDAIVAGPVSGNGAAISLNTGTLTATTTYNILAQGSVGNQGVVFDGNDDKIDCGNNSNVQLSGTQITLEAWIYPTAWKSNVWDGNIINKEACCPDQGYMLRCGDNGKLNFNLGSGSWNEVTSSQNALTLNTWQHVAGTYDGTTMSIYVNGNLVGSQNASFSFFSSAENLTIGNWSPGNSRAFEGKIDDVRIWSVTKSQTDIQTDMASCLDGSEANLAAYYQFGEPTGSTTTFDLSGNGNTGYLQDMDENTAWVEGYGDCAICSAELTGTITVDVAQPTASTITPTSCISYTTPSGNNTYTSSGSYMDTISNLAGCDSVITINLTIVSVDATVTDNNPTFTSNASGATYSWIDCSTGNPISGATSQSFTATSNGTYAVVVTENSCSDTSSCFTVNTVGVNENSFDRISIYPNPTNGMINIDLSGISGVYAYELNTIDGKQVIASSKINSSLITLDISNESKGIYFLRLTGENETKLVKIIKQ